MNLKLLLIVGVIFIAFSTLYLVYREANMPKQQFDQIFTIIDRLTPADEAKESIKQSDVERIKSYFEKVEFETQRGGLQTAEAEQDPEILSLTLTLQKSLVISVEAVKKRYPDLEPSIFSDLPLGADPETIPISFDRSFFDGGRIEFSFEPIKANTKVQLVEIKITYPKSQ